MIVKSYSGTRTLRCDHKGCRERLESFLKAKELRCKAFKEGWVADTANWTLGPHRLVDYCPKHSNKETDNGK